MTRRPRKAPITFRAYADASRYFWAEVRIFETPREMCLDIKRWTGDVDWRTAGQVTGAKRRRHGSLTGIFAVLWLNRKDITRNPTEICSHESVHAAMRYFERRGWSPCLHSDDIHDAPDPHERRIEERLAYAVGRINKWLTRGLFRTGVWK